MLYVVACSRSIIQFAVVGFVVRSELVMRFAVAVAVADQERQDANAAQVTALIPREIDARLLGAWAIASTYRYSFPSGPRPVGRPEARELGPVHDPARHGRRAMPGPRLRHVGRAGPARLAAGPTRHVGRPDSARGPAREHEGPRSPPARAGRPYIRGRGRVDRR
ncbi:hypothetical protein PVAP13_3NG199240 [Panicum virgatum]|uniref:Uncharacterized protein n=1 Tax=Panicum virgatum TaxID=38727 RepID=A0A8T0U6B7_PANVG|nr:hypothetical protein PVAP13_3NG199240 [Panicum virgatum]